MKENRVSRCLMAVVLLIAMTLAVCPVAQAVDEVALNESNFPDAVFRDYLSENYDQNSDGNLSAY